MREAGILVRWFEPLFKSQHFYLGRRLHHKAVVVDGLYSLVGGINICDRYNDLPGDPAWLDMAIYCEGEASYIVYHICRKMWNEEIREPAIAWKGIDEASDRIPELERTEVRVRQNDWVKRKVQIWSSYLEAFNKSEKELLIMCSYFIPGILYRRKLIQAVKKGVEVKVILAGISDIKMAKHAERFLYDWMLKNKIRIYEYQETVLHAKVATYDGSWATVGSYNVNNISAYASLELNLDVRNDRFARHTRETLENIIQHHCQEITRENYISSTSFWRRVMQRVSYSFFNTVLKLFTFYFRQE
jgi:cardiolipin synthase